MKDDLCFPDNSSISYEILAYLFDHPDAQDTIDGILQWWLMERKIKYQADMIRSALNNMVKSGVLVEVKTTGLQARYRISDTGTDTIAKIMREKAAEGKDSTSNK